MSMTYMQAIGEGFPNTQCHSIGDGSVYDNIVHDAGDPIPEKAVLDTWIEARVKEDMWNKIQKERDRRRTGGVKVGSNWFHSDDASRIQQLGLVMFGANMPPGIMWKTLSGSFVTMTPALALQIFQAVAFSDTNIFSVAESKKAAMLVSADPESINYLTGWPLTYGE